MCVSHRKVQYWKEGCARHIPAAQSRLSHYLTTLCADQAATIHAEHTSLDNTAKKSIHKPLHIDNHNHATGDAIKGAAASSDTMNGDSNTRSTPSSRGVVYTGAPKHFKLIYQSLTSLVLSNTTLPAEVWVNYYAFDLCVSIFQSFAFVRCRCFGAHTTSHTYNEDTSSYTAGSSCTSRAVVYGFQSKLHALLSTQFEHVLYMDADNIVTRDASEVFHTTAYRTTGAVLWPDLWGVACKDTSRILAGHTASSQYVLWRAQFPGLDHHTHTVSDYYHRRQNQCGLSSNICERSNISTGTGSSENNCAPPIANTHISRDNHCDTDSTHHALSNNHNSNNNSWRYLREYAQETESGQVVLNVHRHRALLLLALRLMQDSFFSRVFYGDKDIFRYMFLLTGVPFHYLDMPGISVDKEGRQDSLLHFHSPGMTQLQPPEINCCNSWINNTAFSAQYAGANAAHCDTPDESKGMPQLPLFVHQLRKRDPGALLRFLRVPSERRHCASYCLTPQKHRYMNAHTSHCSGTDSEGCCGCDAHINSTCTAIVNSGAATDRDCHNSSARDCIYCGSGVVEQPAAAKQLKDFAQLLFDTVDSEWSYHELATMAQYSSWLPPWRHYFFEYVIVGTYSIAAMGVILDYFNY